MTREFGYVVRKGLNHILDFAEDLQAENGPALPPAAQTAILSLREQTLLLHARIRNLEVEDFTASRADKRATLLETNPGIGPVTASAIVATAGLPRQFKSGREIAALLGLTPPVRAARARPIGSIPGLSLAERKPVRLATVAVANKAARIISTALTRGKPYRPPLTA